MLLAAAAWSPEARGNTVLTRACAQGAASAEPCRSALERAPTADVLALVEQWVASRHYARAQQALALLRQREPRNTQVEQRLHEVGSLAEEAAWLAQRQPQAGPSAPAAATTAAASTASTPSTASTASTPSTTTATATPSGTSVTPDEGEPALLETRCTRLTGEVALAACEQLLARRAGDARILAARGDLLLTQNRAAEALVTYRAAAGHAPAPALAQKIALAEAMLRPVPLALDQQLLALARAQDLGLINRAEYERQRGALLAVQSPAATALATNAAPLDPTALGRFHALVIGNNAYRHLERLGTAVNDARVIGELLRVQYGFAVRALLDATRADIVEVLDEYRSRLEPQDNLLIYYAGHGWLDAEADKGFWLPVDAHPDKRTQWVSNDTVRDALRALKAKHVLVVADSCFSGSLTRSGTVRAGRSADYLLRMARLKARQVLSSGGLEPVADSGGSGHSPFAAALIAALSANTGVLDATSLFAELRRPVALKSDQVPQFADIRLAGHEGGDFLFMRRK